MTDRRRSKPKTARAGSGVFGRRVCARTARPHEDRHARHPLDRTWLLPHPAAGGADRFDPWRDERLRAQHGAGPRRRRRRGRRLYLYGRPQRRRRRCGAAARARRDHDRRGGRPHRAPVAQGLVGAPLRRPRRTDGARAFGLRHGALGPEEPPGRPAAVELPRRFRPPCAVLRRRHRPRSSPRCAAFAPSR